MSDSRPSDPSPPAPAGEEDVGLKPELIASVAKALAAGDVASVERLIQSLHYADTADLLEGLASGDRHAFVEIIRDRFDPEVLPELDESVRDEIAEQLGTEVLAGAIAKLDSDDALYLIEGLEEGKRRQVLQKLPAALRKQLEEGLAFPERSAGRLMQRDFVAVPTFWTVGDTIDYLRESADLPEDFYDLFVVDAKHRPIGTVALNRLLRTKRPVKIGEIIEAEMKTVAVTMDQEDVAFLFKQHDLVSAPVVDHSGRLVGTVTVDDAVDVIEEEAEEDLMRLGGVSESDIHTPAIETARGRMRWLLVTLVNTVIASTVILQFTAAIDHIVALAVLMPIVAAMGGNAGMQVVTVTVRALATRALTPANAARVVVKEVSVGTLNGFVFAAIIGSGAGFWFDDAKLGGVLATAMVFNMVWAGFAGIAIPLAIDRFDLDPAVSAGPFLTTTTDVLGFFSFLGLATWLLL